MTRVSAFGSFFLGITLLIGSLHGCASLRKDYPPLLSEAESLKGQPMAEVKKVLGEPSDRQKNRLFWLLSTSSKYHPEPKIEIFELSFQNDRLVDIKARSQ